MKVANLRNLKKYRKGQIIYEILQSEDNPIRKLGDIDYLLRGRGVLDYTYHYQGKRVQRNITVSFTCISSRDILFFHRGKFRICNKRKELDKYLLKWV